MIEMILIFPVVLFIVFFMLYLGLIKMQEMAILYQVQRVAHQGAMMVASPAYEKLGEYDAKQIDFAAEPSDVDAYYEAYHEDLTTLYRELFGCTWTTQSDLEDFLDKMSKDTMLLAGVSLLKKDVSIKKGLLSTKVDVEVTFGFPAPGVMRYFGYDGNVAFKQGAVQVALNPSAVVRNVDLAADAISLALDKLGGSEAASNILKGIQKIF